MTSLSGSSGSRPEGFPFQRPVGRHGARRVAGRVPPIGAAKRGRIVGSAAVVLAAVGLVVLPVARIEFPHEVARWYVAAASENYLKGDLEQGLVDMDRAISWHDEDPQWYLQRAEFKLGLKQWQSGLEDCNRARKLAPESEKVGTLRSRFLQHLGKHREAVAEWNELLRNESGGALEVRAFLLNNLAYVRAVGKLDLEQGVEEIDEALAILGDRLPVLDPAGVLYFGRGCTEMLQGRDDAALESLGAAATHAESVFRRTSRQVQALASDPRGPGEYARDLNALRLHLSGILKVRSELLHKLNRAEEAKHDDEQLETLKSEGNGIYAEPYELTVAIERVSRYASYLDTRGFLYYQLKEWDAARLDLQRSITASQWLCQAMQWLVEARKNDVTDIRPLERDVQLTRETLAVVTYHRLLVRQALGLEAGVAEDRATIEKLGFEPDEHLF